MNDFEQAKLLAKAKQFQSKQLEQQDFTDYEKYWGSQGWTFQNGNVYPPRVQQLGASSTFDLSQKSIDAIVNGLTENLGKTRLSVNFLELATTLGSLKLLTPSNSFVELNVNAGATVTLTLNVQKSTVFLPVRMMQVVGADHTFAQTISFDNTTIMQDLDVVQARYNFPLDFADILTIYPVLNTSTTVITNTGSSQAYWSSWTTGGIIASDIWNKLVAKYFTVVSEEIDVQVSPRYAT